MKNLKANKVQILAALALAFALGMAMPGAVFADGGEAGEPAAQAENATAGVSTQKLLDVITQATGVSNYTLYKNLVNGYDAVAAATPADGAVSSAVSAVKALVTDAPLTNDSSATEVKNYIAAMSQYQKWSPVINTINEVMKKANVNSESAITAAGLADCTPTQINSWYNAINNVLNPVPATYAENIVVLAGRVKTDGGFANYRTYEPVIASALAYEAKPSDDTLKAALASKVSSVMGVSGAASLSGNALLTHVKEGITDYNKFVALYNSLDFVRKALPSGVTDIAQITAAQLNTKYPTVEGKDPLVDYYNVMASAANAIDAASTSNLLDFKLPQTSAPTTPDDEKKPTTPDSGLIGLIESGAMDLGTVTLIVSVAVAGLAGAALIAKLYLKHKF